MSEERRRSPQESYAEAMRVATERYIRLLGRERRLAEELFAQDSRIALENLNAQMRMIRETEWVYPEFEDEEEEGEEEDFPSSSSSSSSDEEAPAFGPAAPVFGSGPVFGPGGPAFGLIDDDGTDFDHDEEDEEEEGVPSTFRSSLPSTRRISIYSSSPRPSSSHSHSPRPSRSPRPSLRSRVTRRSSSFSHKKPSSSAPARRRQSR